ncbi:Fc.00g101040.m01.CDS01 [Cosmosporella sp. VM-42]
MPLRPALLRSHPPPLRLRAIAESNANGSLFAPPAALRCRARGFHASRCLREDVKLKNHYERLNVRHDATPAEIKKSFYSLSKTHHPDINPSNPNASHTFSLLSESYTILSDPSRRAAYDRDVLRLHHHPHHAAPRGSYHSTHNPAGGRAPSGLSRRRGTFRGPPPSFYRSGGWGTQGEKRRKAHEESTGAGSGSSQEAKPHANPWDSAFKANQAHSDQAYGGMGPGSDPFHDATATPHFDKRGHTRTQTKEDQRRWRRRAMGDDGVEFEPQTSVAGHFFIISGILAATLLAPLVYIQFMRLGRRKDKD